MPTIRSLVAVAALCAVGLVGCAGTPERADTVPAPVASETETAAPTSPPGRGPIATAPADAGPAPKADAGDSLTAAQAKAALLSLDDMPTGWTQSKPEADKDDATITPARCEAVFGGIADGDSVAKAEASFSAGDFGPQLDHEVVSWPTDTAPTLGKMRAALTACPKFTSTATDGSRATFEAAPLSFPNLGDRTLAVRMKGSMEDFDVTVDVVSIASGKNVISLFATGVFQPMKGAELEALARTAVERLNTAAGR